MKLLKIFLVVFVAGMIFACSSAEKKAYKSQEAVNEERLELIDQNKECMEEAEKDKENEAACEK